MTQMVTDPRHTRLPLGMVRFEPGSILICVICEICGLLFVTSRSARFREGW